MLSSWIPYQVYGCMCGLSTNRIHVQTNRWLLVLYTSTLGGPTSWAFRNQYTFVASRPGFVSWLWFIPSRHLRRIIIYQSPHLENGIASPCYFTYIAIVRISWFIYMKHVLAITRHALFYYDYVYSKQSSHIHYHNVTFLCEGAAKDPWLAQCLAILSVD